MIADSPISVRKVFYVLTLLYLGMLAAVAPIYLEILWTLVIGAPLILLGLRDVFQKSQTVPRNFPVWKKAVQNSTNILWNPTQEVAPSTAWNEA